MVTPLATARAWWSIEVGTFYRMDHGPRGGTMDGMASYVHVHVPRTPPGVRLRDAARGCQER